VSGFVQFTTASKDLFFDRLAVLRFMDEAEAKAFTKIGGRIKKTAQRSMRSQKKPKKVRWDDYTPKASNPGQPPRRHGSIGEGITKIYFTYNRTKREVLIGPVKLNHYAYPNVTIPQLHEFGGRVQVIEIDVNTTEQGVSKGPPKWFRATRRMMKRPYNQNRPRRTRTLNFPARPFMFPALEKNKQFINDAWASASISVGE
jgi:hypothetical protein